MGKPSCGRAASIGKAPWSYRVVSGKPHVSTLCWLNFATQPAIAHRSSPAASTKQAVYGDLCSQMPFAQQPGSRNEIEFADPNAGTPRLPVRGSYGKAAPHARRSESSGKESGLNAGRFDENFLDIAYGKCAVTFIDF
jgi:hypothetical protein